MFILKLIRYAIEMLIVLFLIILCRSSSIDKSSNIMGNFTAKYGPRLGISNRANQNLKNAREIFEKKYLEYNLGKFNMNISKMSKQIGMERTALYRKLKPLNIKTE